MKKEKNVKRKAKENTFSYLVGIKKLEIRRIVAVVLIVCMIIISGPIIKVQANENIKGADNIDTSILSNAEYTLIYNQNDFLNIKNNISGKYRLANDITLDTIDTDTYIDKFEGVFDGNGYTISVPGIALFNAIEKNAIVKNFNLKLTRDYILTVDSRFGSVAIQSEGTIEGVKTNGTIVQGTIGWIGGIVGCAYDGIIKYCKNEINFTITNHHATLYNNILGGIVARSDDDVQIYKCWNAGNLTLDIQDSPDSSPQGNSNGGIVGTGNWKTNLIKECANSGLISTSYTNIVEGFAPCSNVGFIVGDDYSVSDRSYNDEKYIIGSSSSFVCSESVLTLKILCINNDRSSTTRKINAEDISYKIKTLLDIQSWWDTVNSSRDDNNEDDSNEEIIKPGSEESKNNVYYIDAVKSKQLILNGLAYSVDESKVSLESLQSFVGKYAYVEFDNSIYHKVISIKEVKSSVGTITQYVEQNSSGMIDSIEIDHKAYEVNNKNIAIIDGRNKRVLYHTIDNQVVGLELLKTEIGYFNGVSEEAKTVKISNEEYSFHEESFISQNIENGKLVVFSVGTKNDDKGNPFLVEMQELQGTPSVWVYVSDDTFSVELGEELDIYCALHIGDYVIPNWKKPSFAIGNDKLITVSNDKQTDLGYHCKVKGVALGQTTLTITDTDTGAHQSFPITVKNKTEMMSYTCRINEVPDFTIESGWDKGLQTNIYNVNGLYVNKYTYKKNNTDGYDVSFNVYNSLNMYGSVDVYDKDGKWIQSVKINKVTGITSLYKTGESLVYLLDDAIHKKSLTYEATTYTKKTGVEISIPKDGYFVISTNYADSPGVMLYNGVDMIMLGLSAVDSAYGKVDYSANLEKYLSNAKEKMLHEALQEAIKSKTKKFVSDQVKEAMTVGYSEAANAIATQTSELLTAEKADKDLCENVCGVGADVLENYMGPAGAALKLLFGIQKYSDYMLQVGQLCKGISKSEIVISSVAEPSVYGITVKPENPQAVGEATLQVFRVSDKDEITSSFEKKTQTQSDKYEIYNICFVKDNVEQEINADVTVSIPIPKSFDANKSAIFRQEKDGSWTKLDSKIDGDYLEFKTNHFSLYAIAEGKTLNNATNLITSITLNMKNGTVDKNGSLKLEATVTPADATNKSLLWSSDNSSVATVDQNGLVAAVSAGKATITVKAQDGSRVEASCIVEVTGTSTGGNDSTGGGSSTGGGGSTSNGSDSTGGNSSTGGDSSNSGNNTTTPGNDSNSTTTEPNIKVLYYIVNFDQNGGTNLSRQKMTLLQDQPLGILPKVVRKNYTFAGWYTQPDGGEKVNSETVLGVSTSLFAHWKKVAKPSKGQISSLKSKKAGTMTVACKKQSGVKGYEIVYSTKKSFKKSATRKATFASTHATVKGLKKGQTYYVKIHAYRIDSTGAKVYGKYSTTKKVKIKK